MKNSLIIIALVLFVSSCKTRKQEPFGRVTKLEDKKWYLASLNGQAMQVKDSSKMFTLEIFSADNAIYLNCECDTTYGLYTAQDEFILLNVLGRTNQNCNPDLFGEYVQQAKSANGFQIKSSKVNGQKSEQLTLFKDDIELMRFNQK
jgi:heat shock protein HslJ